MFMIEHYLQPRILGSAYSRDSNNHRYNIISIEYTYIYYIIFMMINNYLLISKCLIF